ncbi:MAG: hypothetical protein JW776_11825 [Candidatus Lokiarchaeota archaeon]|nr:hypothetical protein [Candidatus Lokiarchaeota archaeon]
MVRLESKISPHRLRLTAYLAISGVILFIVLTTINMFIYPGSYHIGPLDYYSDRYMFIYNNLSDLGMLTTFLGEINYKSAVLFTFTLTITGVSFLLYVQHLPYIFSKDTKSFALAQKGSILGIISSVTYIGVAWTPWDVAIIPHMIFVFIGFLVAIPFNIFFALAILRDESYPNGYAYMLIGFIFLIIGYIFALVFGPSAISTREGRIIESLGQKIIIYSQMVLIVLSAIGSLRVLNTRHSDHVQTSNQ